MSKGIYGDQIRIPGLLAGASLAAKQWHAVQFASTANEVISCYGTAAADKPIGILQNDPADGEPADVCILGVSRAIAGSAGIRYNHILGCNTSGVYNTSGGTVGAISCVGLALESAAAVGDLITVLVTPEVKTRHGA